MDNNYTLASFDGLNNLSHVETGFFIYENRKIKTLVGLDQLNFVGMLVIGKNDSLQTLNGLNKLQIVKNQVRIGGTQFYNESNPLLLDFCAIRSLLLTKNQSDVFISNNGYNPTNQQLIDGQCSH